VEATTELAVQPVQKIAVLIRHEPIKQMRRVVRPIVDLRPTQVVHMASAALKKSLICLDYGTGFENPSLSATAP
jgi:hypothetical protein